jgi:hypothetical protein
MPSFFLLPSSPPPLLPFSFPLASLPSFVLSPSPLFSLFTPLTKNDKQSIVFSYYTPLVHGLSCNIDYGHEIPLEGI